MTETKETINTPNPHILSVGLNRLAEMFDSDVIRETIKIPDFSFDTAPKMFCDAVDMLERFLASNCSDYSCINSQLQNYIGARVIDNLVRLRMAGIVDTEPYMLGCANAVNLIQGDTKFRQTVALGAARFNHVGLVQNTIDNDVYETVLEIACRYDAIDVILALNPDYFNNIEDPTGMVIIYIKARRTRIASHIIETFKPKLRPITFSYTMPDPNLLAFAIKYPQLGLVSRVIEGASIMGDIDTIKAALRMPNDPNIEWVLYFRLACSSGKFYVAGLIMHKLSNDQIQLTYDYVVKCDFEAGVEWLESTGCVPICKK